MNIIQQSIVLAAPPDELYNSYLDPATHAAITGQPVSIGTEAGSEFAAFGGMISGRILYTVPRRLIVQAWRSINFNAEDVDSVLILSFAPDPGGGRIELVHVGVPDQDYEGVQMGWDKYYWTPWRHYLFHG